MAAERRRKAGFAKGADDRVGRSAGRSARLRALEEGAHAVCNDHVLAGRHPENCRSVIWLAQERILSDFGVSDLAHAEDGEAIDDPLPDRAGMLADAAGEDNGIKNWEDAGARSDPGGRPTNE